MSAGLILIYILFDKITSKIYRTCVRVKILTLGTGGRFCRTEFGGAGLYLGCCMSQNFYWKKVSNFWFQ